MPTETPLVKFLTNSEVRPQILQLLREKPRRVCELAGEVDLRRRNVQRNLSMMVDKDLVTKRDGRYVLTVYGHYVEKQYRAFLDEMRPYRRNKSALKHVPMDEPLSRIIIDSGVTFDSIVETVPDALTLIESHVEGAKSVTCVIPAVEIPFTTHLLQSLSSCRSVRLLVDRRVPTETFTPLLAPYDFDPDVSYEETLNHFVIRSDVNTFVGIVDRERVQCIAHSTCPEFAALLDDTLSLSSEA